MEQRTTPRLCVIYGDGIGREVVPAAVTVLKAAIPELEIVEAEAGWDCFLKRGVSVPQETLEAIRGTGAALFGAVSSPSGGHAGPVRGYRSAIVTLRQQLDLYANIRPVRSLPRVSPRPAVDMIIVRENTEGLYSGRERREGQLAIAERVISTAASQRIGRKACELARQLGRRRLTIVHKANVLPLTDGLFRDSVRQVAAAFTDDGFQLEVDELLADTAMLHMVSGPERFDVIVTTNLFGDLLSDAAAYWGGGIGLVPSLNWGEDMIVAEPVHGSAPDIAGRGLANPIATILSAALLARHAWEYIGIADAIEAAVVKALHSEPEPLRWQEGLTSRLLDSILNCLELPPSNAASPGVQAV